MTLKEIAIIVLMILGLGVVGEIDYQEAVHQHEVKR